MVRGYWEHKNEEKGGSAIEDGVRITTENDEVQIWDNGSETGALGWTVKWMVQSEFTADSEQRNNGRRLDGVGVGDKESNSVG